MNRFRWTVRLAALVFLLGTSCVTRPTSAPSNPDPRPPLTDANQQFRTMYAASRTSLLARTRPIVIVDFGRLAS